MRFADLLELTKSDALFESSFLLAGDVDPARIRTQLSRWTSSGRLSQLRRGLYRIEPPYRTSEIHPFVVARRLVPGTRISLQSALAHYGLIPEAVPVTTSVGNTRPRRYDTSSGRFLFRHLSTEPPPGAVEPLELAGGTAWVATPEQALLDLVRLEPGADDERYLRSLRLQNLERLDPDRLERLAAASKKPKLQRAVANLLPLVKEDAEGVFEMVVA